MDVGRAVKRIQSTLGFRQDLAVEALEALQEAQEDLENGLLGILPDFLRRQVTYILPSTTTYVPLVEGFIREYPHAYRSPLWIKDIGPIDKIGSFSQDTYNQSPVYVSYYIENNQIVMNTEFDEQQELEHTFYIKDTVLTQDSDENGWLKEASQLMIGTAGLKLSGVRDTHAQEAFAGMAHAGSSTLIRKDTADRMAGRRLQMGLESYNSSFTNRGYLKNDFDRGE